MKKLRTYICLFTVIIGLSSCSEKKAKNNDHKIIIDTSTSKAKRKIKRITEIEFSDLSGFVHRPAKISFSIKIYLYNEMGTLLEERRYHNYKSVCDVYAKYIYKYDIKENKVEEYYYNSDSRLNLKTVFKYNTNRKMIEEAIFRPNGKLKEKITYKYDIKGNDIERCILNSHGSLSHKGINKFYNNGLMSESSTLWSDGSLTSKITFKYDKKGNKIEEKMYDTDGSFQAKKTYKYDKQSNQIERNLFGQDGSLFITEMYNYVYDEADNWLRKAHFNCNGLMSVTIREITYY